jgi:hypothetical protein
MTINVNIKIFTLLCIVITICLVKQYLLDRAATVCSRQTATSTPTFVQCINNQFEKNGDK